MLLIFLFGFTDCTSGTAEITDHLDRDSGCDTGGCVSARLKTVTAVCTTESCTWTVAADGQVGVVQLRLMLTGASGFESDCDDMPDRHGTVCGVWGELHESFTLVTTANQYGGDTLTKVLPIASGATAPAGQTLFYADPTIVAQTTAYIEITDGLAYRADCAVAGENTSFLEERCPNVWAPFFGG